jgi:hypothetical protein
MYFILVCFLVVNYNALGFKINRHLYEDESDSVDDEQYAVIYQPQFWMNRNDLNAAYIKDAFNVYFMGEKMDGAHPSTFQILTNGYAKDAFNVYYMGKKMDGAHPSTFQILTNGYAKDAFNVYYMGQKIQGASPHTFSVNAFG